MGKLLGIVGAITAVVVAVLALWEPIMKIMKSWWEARVAREQARKAKIEADTAEQHLKELQNGAPVREAQRLAEERELRIQEEVRLINLRHTGATVESTEADEEIKREALRRITDEQWKNRH